MVTTKSHLYNAAYATILPEILDKIILAIDNLKIDNEEKEKIVNAIKEELPLAKASKSTIRVLKNSAAGKSKKTKKRVVPIENQCKRETKSGKKCTGPITDKSLDSCWAHLSEKEKEEYTKTKAAKSKTTTNLDVDTDADANVETESKPKPDINPETKPQKITTNKPKRN